MHIIISQRILTDIQLAAAADNNDIPQEVINQILDNRWATDVGGLLTLKRSGDLVGWGPESRRPLGRRGWFCVVNQGRIERPVV